MSQLCFPRTKSAVRKLTLLLFGQASWVGYCVVLLEERVRWLISRELFELKQTLGRIVYHRILDLKIFIKHDRWDYLSAQLSLLLASELLINQTLLYYLPQHSSPGGFRVIRGVFEQNPELSILELICCYFHKLRMGDWYSNILQ